MPVVLAASVPPCFDALGAFGGHVRHAWGQIATCHFESELVGKYLDSIEVTVSAFHSGADVFHRGDAEAFTS
jgi:hypothetical protein